MSLWPLPLTESIYLTITTYVMYYTIPDNDIVRIDHPMLQDIALKSKIRAISDALPADFDRWIINETIISFDPEVFITRSMIWLFYIRLWLNNFQLPVPFVLICGFIFLFLLPFLYFGIYCLQIGLTVIITFHLLNMQRCWSVAGDPFLALLPTLGWSYLLLSMSSNEFSKSDDDLMAHISFSFAFLCPFLLGFIIFRFI